MVYESRVDRAIEEKTKAVEKLNKIEAKQLQKNNDFGIVTDENRYLSEKVAELTETNRKITQKYETELEELNIKLAVQTNDPKSHRQVSFPL